MKILKEVIERLVEEITFEFKKQLEQIELPNGEQSYLNVEIRHDEIVLGTRSDDLYIVVTNPSEVYKALNLLINVLEYEKTYTRTSNKHTSCDTDKSMQLTVCVKTSVVDDNTVERVIKISGENVYSSNELKYIDDINDSLTADLLSILKQGKRELEAVFDFS